MDDELKKNILKTGTSILGIVCKDGIVMAADRQVTAGNIVMAKNERKISQINDYTLIAATGMVSDSQMLTKVLTAELKLKELRSKARPSIKDATGLFSMLIYRNIRQLSPIMGVVGALVGGYNSDGTFELYTLDFGGAIYKVEDYDANFGSGMPYILGILERGYKKEMSVKDGIQLAIECIKSSTQRDTASGHGIDVFVITKDGIRQEVEERIEPRYVAEERK